MEMTMEMTMEMIIEMTKKKKNLIKVEEECYGS